MTSSTELEGVAWPIASGGDASLPWVERDDESDRFRDDIEAAQHVAKLTGMPVMFTAMSDDLGTTASDLPAKLYPFVFPCLDSSTDDVYGMSWDDAYGVWLRQREERFGSRRERYDEAMGIKRFRVGTRVRVRESLAILGGRAGEVSGYEDSNRWVVLDGESEGRRFDADQLEKEDSNGSD
jgi:hypothetical protein